ncbi:hypothetical protein PHMEG_00012569 [Phytophthora megakarya]|uniref:PiggyBac transposable element-derived protein domain-containing protein n=1 Tax=Phytophthora megakarya TaxID=4795 RepID=A0A225W8F8_9STRA|nr:hypothetical protein PHMEG_00012569 [Phytophthora megakarya]
MGHLHFSNNKSPQAPLDRAWKIRPVVDVLQRTFARYSTFAFAPQSYKTMNKDKPRRWGTKSRALNPRFALDEWDLMTSFGLSIEVYCGAKTHLQTPVLKDNHCGEVAVPRNMNELLPPSASSPWRLVITDRIYTSVKLALELYHLRTYLTGTIQTNRSGFAQGVTPIKEFRTVNKRKVMVIAAMWMDRNPFLLLSSGGSRVAVQLVASMVKSSKCQPRGWFMIITKTWGC